MKLSIRALTPELTADYLDFFDHRAFTDDSPFYPCYCGAFNLSLRQIREELVPRSEAFGGGTEGWKRALRESADRMVRSGSIQGYLAYDGGLSIGWCNANDRLNYYRVGEFDMDQIPEDAPAMGCPRRGYIKSIVCFEISPAYRGRGIAGKLLSRVCLDAAEQGYSFAEAYPKAEVNGTLAFTGPLRLYEKVGFSAYSRGNGTIIMRKALR